MSWSGSLIFNNILKSWVDGMARCLRLRLTCLIVTKFSDFGCMKSVSLIKVQRLLLNLVGTYRRTPIILIIWISKALDSAWILVYYSRLRTVQLIRITLTRYVHRLKASIVWELTMALNNWSLYLGSITLDNERMGDHGGLLWSKLCWYHRLLVAHDMDWLKNNLVW
jgi:hypothetical protein